MNLIRFYRETNAKRGRFIQLRQYIKKMRKYGFYMEVEENVDGTFVVELFGSKLHTDLLGNTAIKP